MDTKEFVTKWLNEHRSPYATEVPKEDQEHFEHILIDLVKAREDEFESERQINLQKIAELENKISELSNKTKI